MQVKGMIAGTPDYGAVTRIILDLANDTRVGH